MKFNAREVAMSTAVFELLAANPADDVASVPHRLTREPSRNQPMALDSAWIRAGGCTYHTTFVCGYVEIHIISCS